MCKDDCVTGCTGSCQGNCYTGCSSGCTNTCQSSGGGCFIGNTLISLVHDRYVRIDELRITDKVLAYNEETRSIEAADILVLQRLDNKTELIEITLENGKIIVTSASHPLLTTEGWAAISPELALKEHQAEAVPLAIGMQVYDQNWNKITITNIVSKPNVNHEPLYNLNIGKYHTFIANEIIVHNAKVAVSVKS